VHSAKGALFENMIIAEALKKVFNSQLTQDLFFWRDRTGNEIDLLTEDSKQVNIVEIKSGRTFRESFLKNLNYYKKISDNKPVKSFLVFGGNETFSYKDTEILAWNAHLSFIKH
jgi:predicted AAA+ superfamily ATPase